MFLVLGPSIEAIFLVQDSLWWGQVNPERKKTALRSRVFFPLCPKPPPPIRVKVRDTRRESNMFQSCLKQEILGEVCPAFTRSQNWVTKLLLQKFRAEWKALCLGPCPPGPYLLSVGQKRTAKLFSNTAHLCFLEPAESWFCSCQWSNHEAEVRAG